MLWRDQSQVNYDKLFQKGGSVKGVEKRVGSKLPLLAREISANYVYIYKYIYLQLFTEVEVNSSRIFIAVLHLYGTRGDTKIWAKIISAHAV